MGSFNFKKSLGCWGGVGWGLSVEAGCGLGEGVVAETGWMVAVGVGRGGWIGGFEGSAGAVSCGI